MLPATLLEEEREDIASRAAEKSINLRSESLRLMMSMWLTSQRNSSRQNESLQISASPAVRDIEIVRRTLRNTEWEYGGDPYEIRCAFWLFISRGRISWID